MRETAQAQEIAAHWSGRLPNVPTAKVGVCFACGLDPARWGGVERAHITAVVNGGDDELENLHLLCRPCHRSSEYLEGAVYWRWLETRTPADALIQVASESGLNVFSLLVEPALRGAAPDHAVLVLLGLEDVESAVMSATSRGADGALLAQVSDAIASLVQSRSTSARTRTAARRAIASGKQWGMPPKVDPAAVARAQALRAEGMTYAQIAQRLDAEGFTPPRAAQWHRKTVSHMVNDQPWGKIARAEWRRRNGGTVGED